jgi:hypothetical protein
MKYLPAALQNFRGRTGFDGDSKVLGACRGCRIPRKSIWQNIVANDETFALAA